MRQTDRQLSMLNCLTDRQFKAKSLKRPNNSKKQRQNWWKSLTPEEQDRFIAKKAEEKASRNIQKNQRLMKKLGLVFDCKQCIHGIIDSCTDRPKGGCVYFADEVNEIYGPKAA